jgi:hypothetical protein
MSTVQILLQRQAYARALSSLLAREGVYEIACVSEPDLKREGVIVADRQALERYPALIQQSERLVLILPNDPDLMSTVWEHNVRSVVFESDPPSTAALAILGLDLQKATAAPAPVHSGSRLVFINGRACSPMCARISPKDCA